MQGVEAQRQEARERKEKWEAEELRGFALARANQTGAGHALRRARVWRLCASRAFALSTCVARFVVTSLLQGDRRRMLDCCVLHERPGGRGGG